MRGSTLAGAGGIAFGVLTAVAVQVSGAPGGSYDAKDTANYVKIGHFPTVVIMGYLAVLAVFGLICLLAYMREAIAAEPDRTMAANIFWGAGLASAASFAVGWALVTGIALAAAEGGSGASVPPATTYVLSDTFLNVIFGSGSIMLGFALIALMLGSRGTFPAWVRWVSLVAGVLALTAPFFFLAPAVPIWGIVIGVWLLVARPSPRNQDGAGAPIRPSWVIIASRSYMPRLPASLASRSSYTPTLDRLAVFPVGGIVA